MKRTKMKRLKYILLLTAALGLTGMMTEGCHGKKCGCMHDLNAVSKHRRHNW